MPKNKGKGGKGKRKGKKGAPAMMRRRSCASRSSAKSMRRYESRWACRMQAYCFDGKMRQCHVPGKFKKRLWINRGDFVLVSLRSYQETRPTSSTSTRSGGRAKAARVRGDTRGRRRLG